MEPDSGMPHLDQVRGNALYTLHVSLPWGNSKTRHHHDGSGDVNPAQEYRPSEHANE